MLSKITLLSFLLAIFQQPLWAIDRDQALKHLPPGHRQFLEAEIWRQSPWYPREGDSIIEKYEGFEKDMARLLKDQGLVNISVYKIPIDAVEIVSSGEIPKYLTDTISDGYLKFYLHPAATEFYKDWLRKTALNFESPDIVLAHQTSSMRSLYILPTQKGEKPFIVKASLPEVIGGSDRRVRKDELIPSVGTTAMLKYAQKSGTFPKQAGFLPEPFGFIPKGDPEAGELFRIFPHSLLHKHPVSLFALYGDPREYGSVQDLIDPRYSREPLLVKILNQVSRPGTEYLRENLIRPFAKIWVQLVIDNGLAPEAHGQNTLVILDSKGMLTGEIYFRDMDGFLVALDYREQLGIPCLGIKYLTCEYKEQAEQFWYGVGWFNDTLASMEYQMKKWQEKGLIPSESNLTRGTLGKILVEELDLSTRLLIPEIKHPQFADLKEFTDWQAGLLSDIATGKIAVPVSIINRRH